MTASKFVVPANEIGRSMIDDDRVRGAVADCDFSGESVVIIGGGGYVGIHIAQLLAECKRAPKVIRLFDMRAPAASETSHPRLKALVDVKTGDVGNADDVDRAVAGMSVVIHVASYGMSGREMLDKARIRHVNVRGTEHVVAASKRHGVKALVYTSSYNAVFCGKPFANARDLPYPKSEDFLDEYSRTKSAAEQLVLGAAKDLNVVALRMAGIYGVGERRHFPRIVRLVRQGMVRMTIGGLTCRQEWVSVANTAFAHVLAAHQLLHNPAAVRGRAFPISEHVATNQYKMLEPLLVALGNPLPRLDLPVWLALIIAGIMDLFLLAVRPMVVLEPILTRGEILKVGVEHYFDPQASVEGLGYRPVVPFHEGIARTIAAFVAEEDAKKLVARSGPSVVPRVLPAVAWTLVAAVLCVLYTTFWAVA